MQWEGQQVTLQENEQANVHVDSSQGGIIKFLLCAIDTPHVYLNSNYTEEVIKEEQPKEAVEAALGLLNLSFPDAMQLLEDPCIWIEDIAATMHLSLRLYDVFYNIFVHMKDLEVVHMP